MLKRVTLPFLFALCVLVSFNPVKAAFPTEKKSEAVVSVPVTKTSDNGFTQTFSNKEVTKESRELKKSATSSGGKSKTVAALLAFFLGFLGIHSFYMGQTQKGFLQLALGILGITLFVAGIAASVTDVGFGGSVSGIAIIGYLLILGVSIWAFVDFIRILTGSLAPEEGFDD